MPRPIGMLIVVMLALLACGLEASANAIRYMVTSLGNIPGTPYDINESGQIVGTFNRNDSGPGGSFLYSNGQFIDTTDSGASGRGINDAGQLTYGFEIGINNAGQTITQHYSVSAESHLVDGMTQTPLPLDPHAINNAGQVVGRAFAAPGFPIAAMFSNGELVKIGLLRGALDAHATAINDKGQVVGGGVYRSSHAFMFDGARLHDLGTLGGEWSLARGINNEGQIVGASTWSDTPGAGWRAFLYENALMLDLNTLIPTDSGWLLSDAMAINDVGQIVGLGRHNGKRDLFLLTPTAVPEPTTLAMMGIVAVAVSARRVRKLTLARQARC